MSSRLIGATLLITGCSIGAGMLGLPVVSALSGFFPSAILFVCAWLFMMTTGLLLLEVNLWFKDDVNFLTMAERTLGRTGKAISGFLFLFLFYCLMVAYISGSGVLVSDFARELFGLELPNWLSSVVTTLLLGGVIWVGTGAVDGINRVFMVGLVLTYVLLIALGWPHIDTHLLDYQNWSFAYVAIPVMVISFGFHNLVPSITSYLDYQKGKIVFAICVGSVIPLIVYLLWNGLIIGLVPLEAVLSGDIATQALRQATHKPWVTDLAEYFAFFALITSFLGVALSIVDFLADGMNMHKGLAQRFALTVLALGPPLVFALIYPNIFLWALTIAGGFSAVILFGVLPALMVWKGRYQEKIAGKPLVLGGKPVLAIVILIACGIVISQIIQELNNRGIIS